MGVLIRTDSMAVEVFGDDWTAIYVDGQLIEQGHSVSAVQLLRALGLNVAARELTVDAQEDAYELPERFEDIKADALVPK